MRNGQMLLCAGVVLLVAGWREPGLATTKTVSVDLQCTATGAKITVEPWRVELDTRDDEIQWVVATTGLDSVFITPKILGRWPFAVSPPLHSKKGAPAAAKGIPQWVAKGKYQYNITGICVRSAARADTVVIDPDMIIPGL